MTDQIQQDAKQIAAIQAFNEDVNKAIIRNFNLNSAMLSEGFNATVVALSGALASADLTAALAVEGGQNVDAIDKLIGDLCEDMKKRATAAFEYYAQQKTTQDTGVEAANDQKATV